MYFGERVPVSAVQRDLRAWQCHGPGIAGVLVSAVVTGSGGSVFSQVGSLVQSSV